MSTLAEMRTSFRASTSGLATTLTDADINNKLTDFHNYILPADIDGKYSEFLWTDTLSTILPLLVVPDHVLSLNKGVFWLNNPATTHPHFLDIWDDFASFQNEYPTRSPVEVGMPTAMCQYGNIIYFDKTPDDTYTFFSTVRGPVVVGIADTGIANFAHAQAVVHGAAWHYLMDKEDDVGADREGARYDTFKTLMLTAAKTDYKGRRPARSY